MLRYLLLLTLVLPLLATPALAQNEDVNFRFDDVEGEDNTPSVINPYDKKYKANLKAEEDEDSLSLVPNYIYFVGMVRKPDADPDHLNMVIVSPGLVVGCVEILQPALEVKKFGNDLQLHLEDGFIDVDAKPHYYHHDCEPKTVMSNTKFTLSKKKLQKDGIKTLTIISENIGPFNKMELDIHDNRVEITSQSYDFEVFGISRKGGKQTFTYWIYPENTVVLSAPGLDTRNEKVRKDIEAFAMRRGLHRLGDVVDGFTTGFHNEKLIYMVDESGRYAEQLKDSENNVIPLGKLVTSEQYFGSTGPYEQEVEKTVYARPPGLYE